MIGSVLRITSGSPVSNQRQTPNRVSEAIKDYGWGGPAAPHPNAPVLVRGRLHGHLARCRSRECGSRERNESTAARCRSPGRSAKDPYVESPLAETRAPVLRAGRSSAGLRESG